MAIVLGTGDGWVVIDREARRTEEHRQQAVTEEAVAQDLQDAARLLEKGRLAEALRSLERTTGRLERSNLPLLQAQVDDRRREMAFVAQLEDIPMQALGYLPDYESDWAEADRAFAAAFAAHGLRVESLPPEDFAGRIRSSGIRTHLVTALDYWAHIKDRLPEGDGEPLRALAQLADNDPWRQNLRDPRIGKDRDALEQLAQDESVLAQSPTNLLFLARSLEAADAQDAAVDLLRRGSSAIRKISG